MKLTIAAAVLAFAATSATSQQALIGSGTFASIASGGATASNGAAAPTNNNGYSASGFARNRGNADAQATAKGSPGNTWKSTAAGSHSNRSNSENYSSGKGAFNRSAGEGFSEGFANSFSGFGITAN